jgi:hypothetical protein
VPPLFLAGAAAAVLLAFAGGLVCGLLGRQGDRPGPSSAAAWTARPLLLSADAGTEVALLPGGTRALLGSGELVDSESGTIRRHALGGPVAGPLVGRSGRSVVGTTPAGVVEVPLPTGGPARTLAANAVEPALSPDESLIAFVRRDGRSSDLWVARRDGSAPRRVARADAAHWAWPVFTADGGSLVFFDVERSGPHAGTGQLFLVRLAEGVVLPWGPDVRLDPGGRPAVLSDGSLAVRTSEARNGLLLGEDGEHAVPLPFGAGLSLLAASPGGETLAARPEGGPLVLWRSSADPT